MTAANFNSNDPHPDYSSNVEPNSALKPGTQAPDSGIQRCGAELLGISVDGAWCHLAFAKDNKLQFPLLADFEPGAVARRYGVYRHQDGVAERALFVLGENGVIHWSYVSPIGVNPGADGILRALESLPVSQTAAA